MANYNKYQRLKKQYSYDGVHWQDVVPAEYMQGEIIEENSPDCGAIPLQYRWFNADPSTDYVCSGYNKFYKQYYQVSEDNGLTWKNVEPEQWQIGEVAELNSIDCGYGISWEIVPGEYICELLEGGVMYGTYSNNNEFDDPIPYIVFIDEDGERHDVDAYKFIDNELNEVSTLETGKFYICIIDDEIFNVDSSYKIDNETSVDYFAYGYSIDVIYPENSIMEVMNMHDKLNKRYNAYISTVNCQDYTNLKKNKYLIDTTYDTITVVGDLFPINNSNVILNQSLWGGFRFADGPTKEINSTVIYYDSNQTIDEIRTISNTTIYNNNDSENITINIDKCYGTVKNDSNSSMVININDMYIDTFELNQRYQNYLKNVGTSYYSADIKRLVAINDNLYCNIENLHVDLSELDETWRIEDLEDPSSTNNEVKKYFSHTFYLDGVNNAYFTIKAGVFNRNNAYLSKGGVIASYNNLYLGISLDDTTNLYINSVQYYAGDTLTIDDLEINIR